MSREEDFMMQDGQEIPDIKKVHVPDLLGKLQVAQSALAEEKRRHAEQLSHERTTLLKAKNKEVQEVKDQNAALLILLQKVQPQLLLEYYLALQVENAQLRQEIGALKTGAASSGPSPTGHADPVTSFIRPASLVMATRKDLEVAVVPSIEPRLGTVRLSETAK